MARELQRPFSRREYARALLVNAATEPFNALILAGVLIAGFLLDKVVLLAVIGLALYVVAVARTFFDDEVAQKVLAEERARRGGAGRPRIDTGTLAPPIAARTCSRQASCCGS